MKRLKQVTKFTLTIIAILFLIASLIWGWSSLNISSEQKGTIVIGSLIVLAGFVLAIWATLGWYEDNPISQSFTITQWAIRIGIVYIVLGLIGQVAKYLIFIPLNTFKPVAWSLDNLGMLAVDWTLCIILVVMGIAVILGILISGICALMIVIELLSTLWHWYE